MAEMPMWIKLIVVVLSLLLVGCKDGQAKTINPISRAQEAQATERLFKAMAEGDLATRANAVAKLYADGKLSPKDAEPHVKKIIADKNGYLYASSLKAVIAGMKSNGCDVTPDIREAIGRLPASKARAWQEVLDYADNPYR